MLKLLKKLPATSYAGIIGCAIGITLGSVTGVVGLGGGVNGALVFGPIGLIIGILSVYTYRSRRSK